MFTSNLVQRKERKYGESVGAQVPKTAQNKNKKRKELVMRLTVSEVWWKRPVVSLEIWDDEDGYPKNAAGKLVEPRTVLRRFPMKRPEAVGDVSDGEGSRHFFRFLLSYKEAQKLTMVVVSSAPLGFCPKVDASVVGPVIYKCMYNYHMEEIPHGKRPPFMGEVREVMTFAESPKVKTALYCLASGCGRFGDCGFVAPELEDYPKQGSKNYFLNRAQEKDDPTFIAVNRRTVDRITGRWLLKGFLK